MFVLTDIKEREALHFSVVNVWEFKNIWKILFL